MKTDTLFCNYDEVHDDYLYQEAWADFIVKNINSGNFTKDTWKSSLKSGVKLFINDFK